MFGIDPLVPLMGRDYKSMKEVKEAFNSNKEFRCPNGIVTTKKELLEQNIHSISIRYKKLTEKMSIDF